MIIRALSLDVLIKYYPFEDYYTRGVGVEGAIMLCLGGHFDLIKNPYRSGFGLKSSSPRKAQEEIYDAIRSIDRQYYLENFRELMDNGHNRHVCPGLSMEFASAFIDATNRSELVNISKKIMSAPFTYGSGWPDLTLVKEGKIIFAEVKETTDVLDASQLTTISEMRALINAECMVVRINNAGRGADSERSKNGHETITVIFPYLSEDDKYIIVMDGLNRRRMIAKSRAGYKILGTTPETVEITMSWKYADYRLKTGELVLP